MFFEKISKLQHTLAFRLTMWYAMIFVFSAGITFSLIYLAVRSAIRQRIDEELRIQANQFSATYALQGADMLQRSAMLQAQAAGEKKVFFRLFYPSGVVFSSSNMFFWKNIGIDRGAVDQLMQADEQVYRVQSAVGHRHRIRVLYTRIGPSIILQLGYSLENENQMLQDFKRIFLVTLSGMLGLAVVIGWFMARRALSGVESVTRTAQRISETDLETRVPLAHRHDEIDRLALTFNQMLDRIHVLVTGIRQMNDNIAHDLRSPITRIRGLAEVTLTSGRGREDYAQMAVSTIEECDRLLSMINTMLTISRFEAGVVPENNSSFDFSALVADACELFQPLAEDKNLILTNTLEPDLKVIGDASMMQRMVANLIDNAVKYTPEGGRIDVRLIVEKNASLLLEVADTGEGVALEDRARVFNRFFRGDKSRTHEGSGLGLSLARAVARAHRGDITLRSAPGQGCVFSVRLPLFKERAA